MNIIDYRYENITDSLILQISSNCNKKPRQKFQGHLCFIGAIFMIYRICFPSPCLTHCFYSVRELIRAFCCKSFFIEATVMEIIFFRVAATFPPRMALAGKAGFFVFLFKSWFSTLSGVKAMSCPFRSILLYWNTYGIYSISVRASLPTATTLPFSLTSFSTP